MKQILLRNWIQPSKTANSVSLDQEPVGSLFEITWCRKKKFETNLYDEISDAELHEFSDLFFSVDNNLMSTIQENVLFYIGGFIVKNLFKKN